MFATCTGCQGLREASRSARNSLRVDDAKLAINSLPPTLTPVNLKLCFFPGTKMNVAATNSHSRRYVLLTAEGSPRENRSREDLDDVVGITDSVGRWTCQRPHRVVTQFLSGRRAPIVQRALSILRSTTFWPWPHRHSSRSKIQHLQYIASGAGKPSSVDPEQVR